jgi:3',5'-cyclic AMP phosphodiesterase CpdA
MSLLRIAHLSDSHFGTILPGVREGLRATLQEIKPDLILLTGDITQRARASQFIEAHEFVESLKPVPVICVPGNHDIPLFNIFGRLLDPYRGFRKYFKYRLEKDYIQGDVVVTGLNSASRWRHVQGDFKLDRVEKRLREKHTEAKVHIAAFHHPVDCAKLQDEKNLLKNAAQTMSLFDRTGIDLIVGGHIHDPSVTLSKTRYPQTERSMVICVAGTCLSWRTRKNAPNSFNLIEVDTRGVPKLTITRYDQRSDLRYTEERVHRFTRPDKQGWVVS